jgi:hypothetical protein
MIAFILQLKGLSCKGYNIDNMSEQVGLEGISRCDMLVMAKERG